MLSTMLDNGFIINGVKWVIGQHPVKAIPLYPKDHIELDSYPSGHEWQESKLKCEKCGKVYTLPRNVDDQKRYVIRDINSRTYKTKRFINLDDEALPLAEEKISSKDNKYFVTSLLTKSKAGLRLVVYAGEKGKKEKAQIFVEPDIKRLAFDQKDLHPTDVFTKLEATFSGGVKATQEKKR